MKKLFLLLSLLTCGLLSYTQAYQYTIRIKGIADTIVMLGHHYGDKQYVIDTVAVNSNGEAVFAGPTPLKGGMYLCVIPSLKNKYFEFLISGSEPKFTLETDTSDLAGNMKVTGSLENKLFFDDIQYVSNRRKEMNDMKEKLKTLEENSADARQLKDQMKLLNEEVEAERKLIIEKHPGLFYTKFLTAITDVKIPDAPLNIDGTKDSTFAYRFIRNHFFDNIDFSDERLLRTTVFDTRIKRFIKDYIVKIPDSIDVAVDEIIAKSKVDSTVFQFVTVMLLNEYATSKIMGFDAVYIHIVDQYYKTGQAFWLDDVGLYKIIANADKVRPTLIGKPAPQLIMQDTSGNDVPLYGLSSKYTVVIFWDVDCGHCKKEMPKIENIYPQLKGYGAEVYAAYTQEEWDKWKKWLREKKYPWVNVGNVKLKSDYQIRYNVDQTPLILILDKNKKIIAKKIGADQILEIIQHDAEDTKP